MEERKRMVWRRAWRVRKQQGEELGKPRKEREGETERSPERKRRELIGLSASHANAFGHRWSQLFPVCVWFVINSEISKP